jgi:hypothetical protein
MPGRKYQAGSESYRYSINGQEKDTELNENITTALYWEYDSRIGRRWNVDPKPNVSLSPYVCLENNPILKNDILGDSTGLGPKPPKLSIRIGGTGGPWGKKESTSIFSLYGNKTYYNSSPNSSTTFKIDEPNSFIQIQARVGGENSNMQFGLNWFKQKTRDNDQGFSYEAPTAVQASFGINNSLGNIGKKIYFSSNLSVGAGVEVGVPRNQINPFITFETKKLLGTNYSLIGVGASAIYRVDATYSNHWTLFLAGTIHHMQTFDQKPSVGTFNAETIGSFAISAGVGVNIGGQHR